MVCGGGIVRGDFCGGCTFEDNCMSGRRALGDRVMHGVGNFVFLLLFLK